MILEIILGFICIVFFFVILNLNRKTEKLEEEIEFYEAYINQFGQRVDEVESKLKQIDRRGTFESDDEVGFFFTYIKELQNDIFQLIGQKGEQQDESTSE